MRIIYLSPHLDDAVFSCGGIIWEQVNESIKVEIWTVFSGDPPIGGLSPFATVLHNRWGSYLNPCAIRREEDKIACSFLGVEHKHLGFPECIYRKNPVSGEWLITNSQDLFETDDLIEEVLVSDIRRNLMDLIIPEDVIVVPLAVGRHVDHRLVRAAVFGIQVESKFYADFPYAALPGTQVVEFLPTRARPIPIHLPVSKHSVLAWIQAIGFYKSQLNSFWQTRQALETSVKVYAESPHGCTLWEL